MRLRGTSIFAILVCALLLNTVGAFPAQAGRASDREVRELVREIGRDLKRFTAAIPRDYRNAVIRGPQGEAHIGAFLDDLAASRDQIDSRMSREYAGSRACLA